MNATPEPGLRRARILVLGSSEVLFTDSGPADVFVTMLATALAGLAPERQWEVRGYVAYQMPSMPDRCLSLARRESPDLILLWLSGSVLAEETVTFAIYHKLPLLYQVIDRVGNLGRAIAGGGTEGAPSLRGQIFRAPRALAKLAFGRASLVPPRVAEESTRQTLVLLSGEWPVRLPPGLSQSSATRPGRIQSDQDRGLQCLPQVRV